MRLLKSMFLNNLFRPKLVSRLSSELSFQVRKRSVSR